MILSNFPPSDAQSFHFWLFAFRDRASLCNSTVCPGTSSCRPGWPWTYRDPPASACQVLGLKIFATVARQSFHFVLSSGYLGSNPRPCSCLAKSCIIELCPQYWYLAFIPVKMLIRFPFREIKERLNSFVHSVLFLGTKSVKVNTRVCGLGWLYGQCVEVLEFSPQGSCSRRGEAAFSSEGQTLNY